LIKEKITNFTILKCTSQYPTNSKDINLKTIKHLKELFNCPVGLSDHTLGSAVPIGSIALGASIIEKHFILNRNDITADSFFSATPSELKEIVDGSKMVYDAVGEVTFPIVKKKSQRSLITIKDIKKGEKFTKENLTIKRPGNGISPMRWNEVIGKTAQRDYKEDEIIEN